MLFNSLVFLKFFIIVYGLYLILPHKWQNRMLLFASYFFYGWWDWRFLSLILFSTILDFVCGQRVFVSEGQKNRKRFLFISIAGNLSVLGFFKYFNFFIENLQQLVRLAGLDPAPLHFNIILPLGISFYTFQTMSYTIDIYRKEMEPTKHFFDFALFVAFFPQLVAGPIERAKRLLPQILKPRKVTWEFFDEGIYLCAWGLFLKIFVAGNLAKIVDPVFVHTATVNGASAWIASYAFAFQIFADFAGYSSIARGLGKMMGFDIILNFRLPFFVTNVQDYWQHWHISLSSWVRDYVYFPLLNALKNIKGNVRIYWALVLAMVLMGLWHGANWTFIIWGVYYGILLALHTAMIAKGIGRIDSDKKWVQRLVYLLKLFFMFHITVVGMMIFRCQDVGQILTMGGVMLEPFNSAGNEAILFGRFLLIVLPVLFVQIGQSISKDPLFLYRQNFFVKGLSYAIMVYLVLGWGIMQAEEFIYFQF